MRPLVLEICSDVDMLAFSFRTDFVKDRVGDGSFRWTFEEGGERNLGLFSPWTPDKGLIHVDSVCL